MQSSPRNWFGPGAGIFQSSPIEQKEMFVSNFNEQTFLPLSTIKTTVLVIDNDLQAHREVQKIIESEGVKVLQATAVKAALQILQQGNCELVLLNAELSEVDSLSFCRLLRAAQTTRQMPIIMFSSQTDEAPKFDALAAGANDFFTRPFAPREMLWRLKFHLQTARQNNFFAERNRELAFLADLGRSLLLTLAPEQVVNRVAGATFEATEAVLCAVVADMAENEPLVCVFNREGSVEGTNEIETERIAFWLRNSVRRDALTIENPEHFLLRDAKHRVEYIAPLTVNGRTKGVLLVGFDRLSDCTETVKRLVDAAAQLASMSVHISSLYDAALDASVYIAKEEQKRFTEAILDSLPVSLYAVDRDFTIVAWNRNRELGLQGVPRESVIGRNVFEVLTRQPREMLEQEFEKAFATGNIERLEQRTTDDRGVMKHWLVSKIPMRDQMTGEVTHVITVGEEITARVEANHAIARAEKLAAVGRLAAGVVHEINNPLATIAACAEALSSRTDEGVFGDAPDVEDLSDYLKLIRSEAFRCKSITNGLLDFSRVRSGQRLPVNIAEIVQSSVNLISHQNRSRKNILKIEVEDNLPLVKADAGHLQQAIIALATNAIDAMPEGGKLTFRAFRQNRRILIEVEDTGIGIPPENLMKIFEPFFTTKEVGKGTGLGLAVCYGIVTEQGGSLNVRSTPGSGTTFTISLPVKEEKSQIE